ncbi:hypothetical protein E4U17_005086 [Claviceps sp. LM77 group G4]|nr:hypothetical protein E4U17_005086 [Claviceps sp. LM77 group G4]
MAPSTRSTPRPEPGLPEQHCGAFDTNLYARVGEQSSALLDLRQEVELMELNNRRTRAAMEAKRLEMDSLLDPVGIHVSHRPQQRGATSRGLDALTGENLHEIICALTNQLPGVAVEDLDNVRTGKMEPWNLIRLCGPVITTNGGFETHTAADFIDNPLLFLRSFGIYTWIYGSFFMKQHPDVVLAQLRFASFITFKAQIFPWKTCLEYAMNRLGSIMTCSIHDAEAWLRHPEEVIQAYFHFVAPAATTASTNSKPIISNKRRRANTNNSSEICLRFNSRKRCRTRDCRRRHVCSRCEGVGHIRGACQRR